MLDLSANYLMPSRCLRTGLHERQGLCFIMGHRLRPLILSTTLNQNGKCFAVILLKSYSANGAGSVLSRIHL